MALALHPVLELQEVFLCLQVAGQSISCVASLSNYTETVPSLSIFTQFTKLYAAAGFDPNPNKGYAVFAPNDEAWKQLFEIVGAHAIRRLQRRVLVCDTAASLFFSITAVSAHVSHSSRPSQKSCCLGSEVHVRLRYALLCSSFSTASLCYT